MRFDNLRTITTALALFLIVGCTSQGAPPAPAAPSPTIAAQIQPAPVRPTPTVAAIGGQPTPSTGSGQVATPIQALLAQPTTALAAEPSIYLWPTYLPPDMRPSPTESRVASDGQTGEAGLGFYIVTLNSGSQKLTIGGGDLSDVLPLNGEQRLITVGTRAGTLITSGDRREIVFNMARGKLFVYSAGLDEQELLKIAESLQPIDVKNLRDLAGTT
jgi:hypothetical protein